MEGTGIRFNYGMTEPLVGEYERRKAPEGMVMELQFADDSALITGTRKSAEAAIHKFASIVARLV